MGEGLLGQYFEDLKMERRVEGVAEELSLCGFQFHLLEEMELLVLLVVV